MITYNKDYSRKKVVHIYPQLDFKLRTLTRFQIKSNAYCSIEATKSFPKESEDAEFIVNSLVPKSVSTSVLIQF